MRRWLNARSVVWLGAALALAAAFFVAGFVINDMLDDGDGGDEQSVVATGTPRATSTRAPTRTPAPNATAAPVASPVAPTAPAQPVRSSPPTATPTRNPEVQILSVSPSIGTHVEVESVDIAIDVRYIAGYNSNVLGWSLLYCASPTDCNTEGFESSVDIVPGSAGFVTLGAPFVAGGAALRPIVLCQYTVEIGRYLTPEAQWQSAVADDDRCHPERAALRIKVTQVFPDLGSDLHDGEVVGVTVTFDTGPATHIVARIFTRNCSGTSSAVGSLDVGTGSAAGTVAVFADAQSAGPLHHVDVWLMQGETALASYSYGPC